jgi:hypothetical protein
MRVGKNTGGDGEKRGRGVGREGGKEGGSEREREIDRWIEMERESKRAREMEREREREMRCREQTGRNGFMKRKRVGRRERTRLMWTCSSASEAARKLSSRTAIITWRRVNIFKTGRGNKCGDSDVSKK